MLTGGTCGAKNRHASVVHDVDSPRVGGRWRSGDLHPHHYQAPWIARLGKCVCDRGAVKKGVFCVGQ